MFSTLRLSCRVSPSDTSHQIQHAWSDGTKRVDSELSSVGKKNTIHARTLVSLFSRSSQKPHWTLPSFSESISRDEGFPRSLSPGERSSASAAAFSSSGFTEKCRLGKFLFESAEVHLEGASTLTDCIDSISQEVDLTRSTCLSLQSSSTSQASSQCVDFTWPESLEDCQERIGTQIPTKTELSATINTITTSRDHRTTCRLLIAGVDPGLTEGLHCSGHQSFVVCCGDRRSCCFHHSSVLSYLCSSHPNRSPLFSAEREDPVSGLLHTGLRSGSRVFCGGGWCKGGDSSVRCACSSTANATGDSDCDAQVDSMSSSDLEHCEDLLAFELACPLPFDTAGVINDSQRPTPPQTLPFDAVDATGSSLNGDGDRHLQIMSLREFEQLPPLSEEGAAELPPLWEDGGRLGMGEVGDGLGGEVEEEGTLTPGQRTKTSRGSVCFVDGTEEGVDNSTDNDADRSSSSEGPTLEERSALIEQTLSEIYESPFQKLIYVSADAQASRQHISKGPSRGKSITFSNPHPENDRLSPDWAPSPTDTHHDDRNDIEEIEDADTVETSRPNDDTLSTMKASIARAAERAVHGYRTCHDADSYVGAEVKPTLILARAPPSPSGILRRTNKKSPARSKADELSNKLVC